MLMVLPSLGRNYTIHVKNAIGRTDTLYSFAGGTTDGGFPDAGLVADGNGNLFGTTGEGGPRYSAQPAATNENSNAPD
jgi:hypothetical protein